MCIRDRITSGAYERHLRRVRRRNGARRATLLAVLSSTLGDRVTIVGADAGLHVVAWFNDLPRAQEPELIARAHAAGLGLYAITPLFASADMAGRPNRAGLVMGYASLDERDIQRGIARLAMVLDALAGRSGP